MVAGGAVVDLQEGKLMGQETLHHDPPEIIALYCKPWPLLDYTVE